jgi:hypothetical protein
VIDGYATNRRKLTANQWKLTLHQISMYIGVEALNVDDKSLFNLADGDLALLVVFPGLGEDLHL